MLQHEGRTGGGGGVRGGREGGLVNETREIVDILPLPGLRTF